MSTIVSVARELWGLFVEDASFTLGILASLAVAAFLLPAMQVPATWRGGALVTMLALVLVENVLRSAKAAGGKMAAVDPAKDVVLDNENLPQ